YFNKNGFFYIHTPIITGSDAEGAGQMFRVTTLPPEHPPRTEDGSVDFSEDFFGKQTNLTVSGQLEGELAAMALGSGGEARAVVERDKLHIFVAPAGAYPSLHQHFAVEVGTCEQVLDAGAAQLVGRHRVGCWCLVPGFWSLIARCSTTHNQKPATSNQKPNMPAKVKPALVAAAARGLTPAEICQY
nr:asparagine--tRNA ligase, chloroplastic/mitochondrial [Tanacetum cinerariifolium]